MGDVTATQQSSPGRKSFESETVTLAATTGGDEVCLNGRIQQYKPNSTGPVTSQKNVIKTQEEARRRKLQELRERELERRTPVKGSNASTEFGHRIDSVSNGNAPRHTETASGEPSNADIMASLNYLLGELAKRGHRHPEE